MIVAVWMATELLTVTPETTIGETALMMARRGIRRVLVVTKRADGGRLAGLVAASDLYRAFPANVNPFSLPVADRSAGAVEALPVWTGIAAAPVSAIMATALVTTTPETLLTTVAMTLREKKIGALPVLRGTDLVGIITESDVFRAFTSLFALEAGDTGLVFEAPAGAVTFSTVVDASVLANVKLSSLVADPSGERTLWCCRVHGASVDRFRDLLWKHGFRVLGIHRG
jgi:acetoin utilization protein AcuB